MVEIVPDYVVIGMVGTGGFGSVLLFILLIHFLVASRKLKKKINVHIKYSALFSLFSSWVFCLGAALWRTNIIFDLNFNSTSDAACRVGFGVQFAFYALSKIFLYLLFTFRLEIVFKESIYKMNSKALWICRTVCCTLSIACIIGVIGFLPKIIVKTKDKNILLCTGDTGFTSNFGDISIITSVIADITVTALLALIFIHKLRQV